VSVQTVAVATENNIGSLLGSATPINSPSTTMSLGDLCLGELLSTFRFPTLVDSHQKILHDDYSPYPKHQTTTGDEFRNEVLHTFQPGTTMRKSLRYINRGADRKDNSRSCHWGFTVL
jgi:hypothetical protein